MRGTVLTGGRIVCTGRNCEGGGGRRRCRADKAVVLFDLFLGRRMGEFCDLTFEAKEVSRIQQSS